MSLLIFVMELEDGQFQLKTGSTQSDETKGFYLTGRRWKLLKKKISKFQLESTPSRDHTELT